MVLDKVKDVAFNQANHCNIPPLKPREPTVCTVEETGACHECLRDLLASTSCKNTKKKLPGRKISSSLWHAGDGKYCQTAVPDLVTAIYCSSFFADSPREAQFGLCNCEKSGVMLVAPSLLLLVIASVFPRETSSQEEGL